jgi:redox-sensing transcriptional repressor
VISDPYYCDIFHKSCELVAWSGSRGPGGSLVPRRISDSTIRRLSHYLRALEDLEVEGTGTVSSNDLADRGGTTAAQVRKDLSQFGSFGKRGLGYAVPELMATLRKILGLDRRWRVALVGAGRIGSALFEYPNFAERGFDCVAVLDSDPAKIGCSWGNIGIRDSAELEEAIQALGIDLVILAVPQSVAQSICDRAIAAGAKGIMNFATVHLRVPGGVHLSNVNLVLEMEALSFAITQAGLTE